MDCGYLCFRRDVPQVLFANLDRCLQELFVCKLAKESYEANDKPKCVEYSHLADYVQENDELEFLHGLWLSQHNYLNSRVD